MRCGGLFALEDAGEGEGGEKDGDDEEAGGGGEVFARRLAIALLGEAAEGEPGGAGGEGA